MKKKITIIGISAVVLCLLTVCVWAMKSPGRQAKKEIYVFSQPCHYCAIMKRYVEGTVIPKYPEIDVKILDIREKENKDLFHKFIKAYKIKGNRIGLPLIFVNDQYLLGWSDEQEGELIKAMDKLLEMPEAPAYPAL